MVCSIENIYFISTCIVCVTCFFLCIAIILQNPKDNASFGQTNLWGNNTGNIESSNNVNVFFEKIAWCLLIFLIIFILSVSVLLRKL
jgi:preprotein translocase subunit SecG